MSGFSVSKDRIRILAGTALWAPIGALLFSGSRLQAEVSNEGDFLDPPTFLNSDNAVLAIGAPGIPEGWEVTAAAGLSLAQGNADSLSYSLQGLATYEGEDWTGQVGADYFYSQNEGETTTDSLRIFAQGQRELGERWYIGLAGAFLRDDQADLDYRFDIASVFGYHLIKTDQTSLSFEAGPGFAIENQGGSTEGLATLRFTERFEHQLSKRSKIWQNATYTPEISDFENFLLVAELGLDVLLSKHWSLRTSVRYLYDNTPAEGLESGDVALLAGLAYALGGFDEAAAEAGRDSLKPDAVAEAAPSLGWTTSAALGVSLAQGNSENLAVTASYDTAYRTTENEWFLNGAYTFGESGGETSSDALRIGTRFNRLFSDRLYGGFGVDFLRDDLAEVDYRVSLSPVLGYYAVKNDVASLAFETGPGYIFEEVGGQQDDYFTVRFAERFDWTLNSRMTFKQAAVVDLEPENTDNFLLTLTAFLDTEVTDNLSWRISGTYVFDNEPAEGLEDSDVTLSSGIAVKF